MSQWVLYKISDRKESRNGNDEYFIITFFNTETKTTAHTYITIGYRNNAWWGDVILDDRYGIYTFKHLKTKVSGNKTLIDGDSIPQIITATTQSEASAIVDIMRSQNGT